MGCINSKRAVLAASPASQYSAVIQENGSGILGSSLKIASGFGELEEKKTEEGEDQERELGKLVRGGSNGKFSFSFRMGNNVHRHVHVEAEQAAAGWPGWLSAVASEAIHGWVPLRPDSFEKLEKVGQGTYSSVFKARDIESGRIVALKKVHFDNFQQESIRFMAREITILRRLEHPNIMKLEGIITSRSSSSIYLVFEYMEHDLAGLISSPDIKFSDSQIKCYMQQLLFGLEHCHLRGIMHRDIKASNILLNNQGNLKVADFGLANFLSSRNKQPLTSRVVTLWYRPPELLLGSTSYEVSVDLWSVGCVFAELLFRKPILKGRTEVEQLHKIFKLCGSPSEDFWKRYKLPYATMFKPQHPYESSLRERCKEFPTAAVKLIETFLSVEPLKRGTASSALMSEYFNTKPFACDPSSLPKYPPTKEIDAKGRDEARKRKAGVRTRGTGPSRKPRKGLKSLQEASNTSKPVPKEEVQATGNLANRIDVGNKQLPKRAGVAGVPLSSSFDTASEISQLTTASQGDILPSGPLQFTPSSSFAWAKRQNVEGSYVRSNSRRQAFSAINQPSYARNTGDCRNQENGDTSHSLRFDSRGRGSNDNIARRAMRNQRALFNRPDSFDASDIRHSQELSGHKIQRERVDHSGPLLSESHRVDDLLLKHERYIRQAVRKSRLQIGA